MRNALCSILTCLHLLDEIGRDVGAGGADQCRGARRHKAHQIRARACVQAFRSDQEPQGRFERNCRMHAIVLVITNLLVRPEGSVTDAQSSATSAASSCLHCHWQAVASTIIALLFIRGTR